MDVDMGHEAPADSALGLHSTSLPSKPVLEMALNIQTFTEEVKECLRLGLVSEIEYVLLKIAMEIQDKANMLTMM